MPELPATAQQNFEEKQLQEGRRSAKNQFPFRTWGLTVVLDTKPVL